MRVKGTAIIDLVKIIRSQKQHPWDQYLQPSDHKVIQSIILPSSYYPGDSFWRLSWAVVNEIGKGSLDSAFVFGRSSAKTYLDVYKRLVAQGDPAKTVGNFVDLWENFYDFEGAPFRKMTVEKAANQIRIIAHDYPDMIIPEVRRPYFYGLAGYFQEILERASGRSIQNSITDHGSSFELTYRWS